MKSYSANYPLVLASSHRPEIKATIIIGTSSPAPLTVVQGDVSLDRTAEIRASLKMSLADEAGTLTPSQANDLLLPFVHELVIERGVYIPGVAAPEMFRLGVFRLTAATAEEKDGQITINVEGSDRAERVRQPLLKPYSAAAGAKWTGVIKNLITLQYPNASFSSVWPVDEETLDANSQQTRPDPAMLAPAIAIDAQGDAWTKCLEGAAAIGRELYVNSDGEFTLSDIPNVQTGIPAWHYIEGQNATHIDTTKAYTAEEMFNGVIVTSNSSATSSTIRGEAWDDNPASKISRVNIGPRPKTVSADVANNAAATARAQVELSKILAGVDQVSFSAIPNPALEVGDLIYYQRSRLGLSGNYIVNRISIPLEPLGLMTVNAGRH